jgi:uncharacterized membrane protein
MDNRFRTAQGWFRRFLDFPHQHPYNHAMSDHKPYSFVQRLSRWLVPTSALLTLAVWIYIAPPGLMGKLDAVGYAVCHRLDSHSLHIGNIQMPLCARCTGEFNAATIGLVFQIVLGGRKSRLPKRGILAVLLVFFLAFAIDGSNSYLALLKNSYAGALKTIPNLYITNNASRVFTGSGMGIVMASLLYPMYNQSVWRIPAEQPVLDWRKFGALIGLVFLFDVAMLTESPWILYPVALLSTLGVLALLTIVFSIVWIMVMREENTFVHVSQLWLPAAAGLTLAFLLILGIDLFRFNLTHTWQGFPGLKG